VNLDDFAGKHQGEIAYVIGSGNTGAFFEPSFFDNQLTIGVNYGWAEWLPRVTYMLTKYHHLANKWARSDRIQRLIVSRGHTGQLDRIMEDREDLTVFDHKPNRVQDFTAVDFPDTGLVVSYSSISSAIHFAATLGASAIITVGADCGWIDDKGNVGNYKQSLIDELALHFELQNRIIAQEIRQRYSIPVMCLLPFITPNMEGHKFTSPFGAINAT